MKILSVTEICYENIDFQIFDIFPEAWLQQKEFSLYQNKLRPVSAIFFVCSDITVSFFSADGGGELCAQKGDVVYIPRGSRYSVRVKGKTGEKMDTYTVNLCLFNELREEILLSDKIEILARCEDHRGEIHMQRLCDAFHREKKNLARTKGEFFLLLELISSSVSPCENLYYPIRRGVRALCEEWNKNERIEKYAKISGVSLTYFYRCFRKWSGSSPVEYRNMLRLSNAESLLRCTDRRVQEISEAVGFTDPFYFCRLFSQIYGVSPKHYRTQKASDGNERKSL
ncbi:MAG: helix-turn-helix transcriptional regulator [Clostridia bacterium]|nr:helix-turn-helix transcriptional regulator [Clostridia bacterium]